MFTITCRHKHIEKECEVKDCDTKFPNRHIKACRYGSRFKRISECAFKHIEKEKHSEKEKLNEKNNTEKALIQAKVELGTLDIEVNTLRLNIEEQKKLLHQVNHD